MHFIICSVCHSFFTYLFIHKYLGFLLLEQVLWTQFALILELLDI